MKNSDIYISHILDSIARIKLYIANKSFKDFSNDTELHDAVVRNLEIIGEASRRLPDKFKLAVNLPWDDISAMRNKIAHDYFELNLAIIWKTATIDILEVEKELSPYNPEKK
ncbi:MAG: HepT-like ribonuclease domain-containing protein [Patescibacteria group bacterium]